MKNIWFFCAILLFNTIGKDITAVGGNTSDFNFTCRSCILMEASTGKVIYEKNSDKEVAPASITKIMTLLLICDEINSGRLKLSDQVVTSEKARNMTGSKVFLERGEVQDVETMIKCIVVASGNDASVAMAEHISGSEEAFVKRMNEKAKEIGMKNTNFEDCSGLTDSDGHYTCAYDVAIMSKELINTYPDILKYSSIWMENIVHTTKQGSKEFGLTNTNKLIRQYEYANGLKTGSTSKAKYCVSATAKKDNIQLIAVIMGAEDYKVRFSEAASLLNYGFATCSLYHDEKGVKDLKINVTGGISDKTGVKCEKEFSYVSVDGEDLSDVKKKVTTEKELKAPVKKNQVVGKVIYYIGKKEIGSVNLIAEKAVNKAGYFDYLKMLIKKTGI